MKLPICILLAICLAGCGPKAPIQPSVPPVPVVPTIITALDVAIPIADAAITSAVHQGGLSQSSAAPLFAWLDAAQEVVSVAKTKPNDKEALLAAAGALAQSPPVWEWIGSQPGDSGRAWLAATLAAVSVAVQEIAKEVNP